MYVYECICVYTDIHVRCIYTYVHVYICMCIYIYIFNTNLSFLNGVVGEGQ